MRTDYLYRHLCRLSTLQAAWVRVAESDGCAGVDAVTISTFAQNLDHELSRLSTELLKETYQPLPLLRFFVTKANGGQRPLSVPVVRDRVVQNGVIAVVEPRFEKEFENCSFAYRRGRSVKQALQQIEYLHGCGYQWVLDADITSYFDNVDHGLLLARVSELITSKRVVGLIEKSISAKIYDGRHLSEHTKGLPQGSPLSPLLANLYLDSFDDQMLAAGQKLVRFADDFVVLCKSKPRAEKALKLSRQLLANLRLTLSDEKTRVTSFSEGFKYLGASFIGDLSLVRSRSKADLTSAQPVLMPPSLPILRAAPVRSRPFNSAVRDALMAAFDDVSAEQIPSFFKRPRRLSSQSASDGAQPPASESGIPFSPAPLSVDDAASGIFGDAMNPPAPPDVPGGPKMPPPNFFTLRTLYVHEHGAIIRCEDEHLRIFKDDVELLSLPAFKIDQIILFGNSQVTTSAMKFCLRNLIPIVVLSGTGQFFGAIESTNNQNVLLHQKQFERLADQKFVLETARQIVSGKIWNSRTLLQRRQRKEPKDRVRQSINELLALGEQLASAATLEQVRGHEGAAAASYFAAYAACVPSAFGFKNRNRQPPLDPVNALLSFGYTLLFYNIFSIVRARGLSPYVGNLHALRQGHPALCSDLIEELRAPIVDSLVTSLLNKQIFTPADFYYDETELPVVLSAGIDSEKSGFHIDSASVAKPDQLGNAVEVSGDESETIAAITQSNVKRNRTRGCFLTDKARRSFIEQFERRMNTIVLHPNAKVRTTWRGCIDIQVGHFIQLVRSEADRYFPIEIR
jgi:CRISPR-associated protein Cas1